MSRIALSTVTALLAGIEPLADDELREELRASFLPGEEWRRYGSIRFPTGVRPNLLNMRFERGSGRATAELKNGGPPAPERVVLEALVLLLRIEQNKRSFAAQAAAATRARRRQRQADHEQWLQEFL